MTKSNIVTVMTFRPEETGTTITIDDKKTVIALLAMNVKPVKLVRRSHRGFVVFLESEASEPRIKFLSGIEINVDLSAALNAIDRWESMMSAVQSQEIT